MISFCPMKVDRQKGMVLIDSEAPKILEISDLPGIIGVSDITYNFNITIVNDSVLVKGSASVTIDVECGRCLDRYQYILKDDGICHFYEGASDKSHLNITQEIREDLLVKLPQYFICNEECEGLCQHCGVKKSECTCKGASVDAGFEEEEEETSLQNPWEILDVLKEKPKAPKKSIKAPAKKKPKTEKLSAAPEKKKAAPKKKKV